ncbi:MAG: hypothetical protein QOD81_277 [Solirubrobacteraceae bacterium]|nr:hypothetical protein [Solirubrobacteraceae bacterium]
MTRRTRLARPSAAHAVIAAIALAALGGALVAPALSDAQSEGTLRSRADRSKAREGALAGDVARLGRLIGRLDADLAVIGRRRAEVQAELDADVQRLATVRAELRGQRRRVERLRARLREARTVLSHRMVELYQAPQPDIVTVVMKAHGFADLLEQATYVRAVGAQDSRVIHLVRRARVDAAGAVRTLARDERRQEDITAQVQTRRIAALEAARARAARAVGPGGPWAIPWPIVQCESGGQNLPPNSAGASGYYQIVPGTWSLYGGSGPHAYLASKAEQDQVATRIWSGGSGASQWVCAALVR